MNSSQRKNIARHKKMHEKLTTKRFEFNAKKINMFQN